MRVSLYIDNDMPASPSVPVRPRGSSPRLRQVPAVTRAAAILRLLGRSAQPLGVNAIARDLGLVASTCLHILRALAAEELVAFDPDTRRYSLGPGLLSLARGVLRRSGFRQAVQPALDQLCARHGMTAIGVQVVGLDHMVVMAIARSDQPLRLHVDIGSRFPALISATGRCLAAFGGHSAEALAARFGALRWDRPPTLDDWRADVEATRRRGYSVDAGRYIRGVTIVAVPVLDAHGQMTHGIVAVGLGAEVEKAGAAALARDMRALARDVSEQLGSA